MICTISLNVCYVVVTITNIEDSLELGGVGHRWRGSMNNSRNVLHYKTLQVSLVTVNFMGDVISLAHDLWVF